MRSRQDIPARGREGADRLRGWRPPVPGDRRRISGCSGCSARRSSILPVVQRVRAAHAAECLRAFDPAPRGEPAFGHGGWACGRAARRQQQRSAAGGCESPRAGWVWRREPRRRLAGGGRAQSSIGAPAVTTSGLAVPCGLRASPSCTAAAAPAAPRSPACRRRDSADGIPRKGGPRRG